MIKIGCCGFRIRQDEYFLRFPIVEVQQTFYRPPRVETLERWRAAAPADFEFTLKAWMLITHDASSPVYRRLRRPLDESEREGCGGFRDTEVVRAAWSATLASARALGARRVLFQCPPSLGPTVENADAIRHFFSTIAAGAELEYLWEPRGGWPDDLVRGLCDELDLVHVVDPFSARTVTPRRVYYRIHGRRGLAYEDEELEALLEVLPDEGASFVLFNNLRMVRDAERFMKIAGARALPPRAR